MIRAAGLTGERPPRPSPCRQRASAQRQRRLLRPHERPGQAPRIMPSSSGCGPPAGVHPNPGASLKWHSKREAERKTTGSMNGRRILALATDSWRHKDLS